MDMTLKTDEPEKLHEHTQAMIDQIDAMSSIAESFSRFAEMPEYKREQVDVCELVNRSVAIYTNLSIKTALPKEPIYGLLDRELMIRVFNNLVKNASQAVPLGRKLKIPLLSSWPGKYSSSFFLLHRLIILLQYIISLRPGHMH